ncbi:MAG: hypothetical protein EPN91_00455 [Salinibacterium sp.]|nr:MAG: hypothetical protein EPN91_00455 [Salinibacterium sp.]
MSATVIFTGTGLDDLTAGGTYDTPSVQAVFDVEIDANGTPDTFKWRKNGGTWTTDVEITGTAQTLSNGVTILFAATTGHTVGDSWQITESPADPDWVGRIGSYLNLAADKLAQPNVLTGLTNIGQYVQTQIEKLTGRPFDSATFSEAYSGEGKSSLFLRRDPIIAVTSLSVDGTDLTVGDMDDASTIAAADVLIGPDRASLEYKDGGYFPCGTANVLVDYSAGLQSDEGLVMLGVQWGAELWKSGSWAGAQRVAGAGTTVGKFTDWCPPGIQKGIMAYRRAFGVR